MKRNHTIHFDWHFAEHFAPWKSFITIAVWLMEKVQPNWEEFLPSTILEALHVTHAQGHAGHPGDEKEGRGGCKSFLNGQFLQQRLYCGCTHLFWHFLTSLIQRMLLWLQLEQELGQLDYLPGKLFQYTVR